MAKICVPERLGNTWLPCDKNFNLTTSEGDGDGDDDDGGDERRKLISYGQQMVWRRALASGTDQYDYCLNRVRNQHLNLCYFISILILFSRI